MAGGLVAYSLRVPGQRQPCAFRSAEIRDCQTGSTIIRFVLIREVFDSKRGIRKPTQSIPWRFRRPRRGGLPGSDSSTSDCGICCRHASCPTCCRKRTRDNGRHTGQRHGLCRRPGTRRDCHDHAHAYRYETIRANRRGRQLLRVRTQGWRPLYDSAAHCNYKTHLITVDSTPRDMAATLSRHCDEAGS